MATATHLPISVHEYLHTSYSPDCDYVDGVVEERNLGELEHAEVQAALLAWFRKYRHEWGIKVLPEIRIQTTATRFRIADVCLISSSAPREQIIQTTPLVVIEILSPEDRVSRYQQRLEDYRNMGVRNIWVIDPSDHKAFDCSTGSWIETAHFSVSDTPIHLDVGAMFADIDEA